MPSFFSMVADVYIFFQSHRKSLVVLVLLGVAFGTAGLFRVHTHENIMAMLPDDNSEVTTLFELLQKSPQSRKVIVNLFRTDGGDDSAPEDSPALPDAANRLAMAMGPPFFENPVATVGVTNVQRFTEWLLAELPNLLSPDEFGQLQQMIDEESISTRLENAKKQLQSPMGWFLKDLIPSDPLGLREIMLEKLQNLQLISNLRIENGYMLNAAGTNLLLVADTPVPITDSDGARELLDHFSRLKDRTLPDGIDAVLISGHRYAAANAAVIKSDVRRLLFFSLAAILAIFFFYLRSLRAFWVFLVPVSVLLFAISGVSVVYGEVSAITVGFGAVLLGISVDYAIHVYFALTYRLTGPAKALAAVARPVLMGGLTTISAFSLLLFSNLPGQRQLAVFTVIGLGAALVWSLIPLPHLLGPRTADPAAIAGTRWNAPAKGSKAQYTALFVILCVCLVFAFRIHVDGDLRSLNFVPLTLQEDEKRFQSEWGDFRANAMIFSSSVDLDSALAVNSSLYRYLSRDIPTGRMVSLAPVFPSREEQAENRQRWKHFWQTHLPSVRPLLVNRGEALGFTRNAFEPFFRSVASDPDPVTLDGLRRVGLGSLLDSMVISEKGAWRIITYVPDIPEVAQMMATGGAPQGTRLVSQNRFQRLASDSVRNDFIRFLLSAFFVVLILLAAMFRNTRQVIAALVPVLTGLVFMLGIMGALSMSFNLFNIVATILVIGLGVDYGIFMISRTGNIPDSATRRAIWVSGLTTIAGFGGLVLARHPALHSIGVTVLLGIGAAMVGAIWITPLVLGQVNPRTDVGDEHRDSI